MEEQNNKVATQDAKHLPGENPFAIKRADHLNAGAVQIEESRAIAEAQGKLIIAKRFPRDEAAAFEQVMLACSRKSLADAAMYAYPRGGQNITGPSIRLAEALAMAWGNIDFGIRELSQKDGISEMEAYCWDLQTNTHSSFKFTVKHERHTNEYVGGRKTGNVIVTKLTDPRDIYELCANNGGRRLRARILSVLPPDLVEAAITRCKATLAGDTKEPLQDRVKKMLVAFNSYGVTKTHIETMIGVKIDAILPDQFVDLIAIYNSIKDGVKSASEWFGKGAEATPDAINALNEEASTKAKPNTARAKTPAPAKPTPAKAAAKTPPGETPIAPPAAPVAPEPLPEPEVELPDALFPDNDELL